MPGCEGTATAERSYRVSKVGGAAGRETSASEVRAATGGLPCDPRSRRREKATPHPRPRAAAGRRHLARGQGE